MGTEVTCISQDEIKRVGIEKTEELVFIQMPQTLWIRPCWYTASPYRKLKLEAVYPYIENEQNCSVQQFIASDSLIQTALRYYDLEHERSRSFIRMRVFDKFVNVSWVHCSILLREGDDVASKYRAAAPLGIHYSRTARDGSVGVSEIRQLRGDQRKQRCLRRGPAGHEPKRVQV